MKFGRLYEMSVQGATTAHTIQYPLTCRFRVMNNSLFSCGQATFQVYNLSEDVRNDIYQDAYDIGQYRHVEFAAGYQADTANPGAITLPIIYKGNIKQAYSFRQGPDWVTQIDALDGGFDIDTASINLTKPGNWNFEDVIRDLVKGMPHLTMGTIGNITIPNSRGITLCGSPWDIITRMVQPLEGKAFINKETVNVVHQWEYINDLGTVNVISGETGIIGTPLSQEGLVKVRMIFEPRLEVYQKIKLETPSIPQSILRQGDFVILGLVHSGTISGAVCEALTTEATCFQPDRTLVAA